VALLSGLLAGCVLLLLLHRPSARRLLDVAAAPTGPDVGTGPRSRAAPATGLAPALLTSSRGPLLACILAAAAVALLLPQPVGLLAGVAVAVAGPRLLDRLEPQAARDERARQVSDLPLVLDLLGACLVGGAPLSEAVRAVAAAVGGPVGRRLDTVVASLAVGTPPADAWAALASGGPEDPLAPAARALARAADGGAPVAASVVRLAVEARAAARSHGEQAARRAGVLVVAPLGMCFLPAFVLLGVVPVVAGLAGPLLAP